MVTLKNKRLEVLQREKEEKEARMAAGTRVSPDAAMERLKGWPLV